MERGTDDKNAEKPEDIVNMRGLFTKKKERRYCPGYDGVQHIVDVPDGKAPGELCNPCLDRIQR